MENSPNRTVVIASNNADYGYYLNQKLRHSMYTSKYFYVGAEVSIDQRLRGYRALDFIVTDLGKERRDIDYIFETLMMCNVGTELEAKTKIYRLLYL